MNKLNCSKCSEIKCCCKKGKRGKRGHTGKNGTNGTNGKNGTNGTNGILGSAEFYTLSSANDTITINAGENIPFINDGPILGPFITRIDNSTFTLGPIGIYQVSFNIATSGESNPHQIGILLNSTIQPNTVKRTLNAGSSNIIGSNLIQTTEINSIVSLNNLSTTLFKFAYYDIGGPNAIASNITITYLQLP